MNVFYHASPQGRGSGGPFSSTVEYMVGTYTLTYLVWARVVKAKDQQPEPIATGR